MKNSFDIENPPKKSGLRGLVGRLPALLRFSDPNQRRTGGYIVSFAAGLLVLTLIARGTGAATLAKVETTAPERNDIVEAVTGKANVSVRDTLDVFAPEGLTISEISVGQGQTVQVGDAIAQFDMDEVLEKLARENAALEKLLLDLEKLERTEDADATSLESAERNLTRVQEDYAAVKTQGETDIAEAKKTLEDAWAKQAEDPDAATLDAARRSLQRAHEDYNATVAQNNSDIAAAETALDEALKKNTDSPDYTSLETAQRALARAKEDYDAIKAQGEKDVAAALATYEAAQSVADTKLIEWESAADIDKPAAEHAYLAAKAESENANAAYETAKTIADESLTSARRRVEDAEAALSRAEQDYYKGSSQASDSKQTGIDNARAALDAAKKRAADNLTSAQRRVEDAEIALQKAEQDYSKNSEQSTDSLQDEIDKAQDALAAAQKKADENLLSASRRVEDAEISLSKAGQDFGKSEQQAADTTTQNSISAATLRLDIDKQNVTVDTLKILAAENGILYSDIAGVVSSAKAEGSTTDKTALVAFMDGAKGFEAHLQLAKADAEKLTVGDACEVTTSGGSMYYTPTVTGTVSAISAPDEQDRVQVTIRLPEDDWFEGQSVEVQAVQDKNTYDLCVPLSALHSDNTGYYLLVVEQKSTVLGVENVAVKVYVSLVASDDETAAVQGPVDRSSPVITGSNKAVTAGDRVRMKSQ